MTVTLLLTVMVFYFTYWVVSGDFIQRKYSWLKKKNVSLIYFSHTVEGTVEPVISRLHRPQGLMVESSFL